MKFKSLVAIIALAFSTASLANVSVDMFKMNRQMGGLLNADSVEEFQESAKSFLNAAEKAKQTMPKSLDGDQEKFKGYQQAMQEVIDTVIQANELANQGKLEEAKTTAGKLNQLKKIYHSEYK